MIPKVIHYFWIGGNPKPKSVLRCIESWKKYCPDYEIREWNESNYDFTKNPYMSQAYAARKWSFVTDYARLDVIYEQGGIYLDTDVEAIRSFDRLRDCQCFLGFEAPEGHQEPSVNTGLGFGAEPRSEIIRTLRDAYDGEVFLRPDGTYNMRTAPAYSTDALCGLGLVREDRDQQLPGAAIYASDVLCPREFISGKTHITDRTVSIHHFDASWFDQDRQRDRRFALRCRKLFGQRLGPKIANAIIFARRGDGSFREGVLWNLRQIKKKLFHKAGTP